MHPRLVCDARGNHSLFRHSYRISSPHDDGLAASGPDLLVVGVVLGRAARAGLVAVAAAASATVDLHPLALARDAIAFAAADGSCWVAER